MAVRIAHHQRQRPSEWTTVEEPLALAHALQQWCAPGRLVLVDCLTLWLSNLMFADGTEYPDVGEIALPERFHAERAALLAVLAQAAGAKDATNAVEDIVLVSNEVGMGIVPYGAISRAFTDEAGRLNQAVAAVRTMLMGLSATVIALLLAAVVTAAAAAPPLVELATEPPGANCAPRPDVVRAAALVASTPSGTAVFQASARPAIWSGNFTRSALSVDDAGAPLLSAPQWDAAALLDALPDASSSRRIYTSKLVQGVRLTVPLVWEQLSAAQRTALNRPPPPAPAAPDQRGKQRLAWLRGDRSQEGRLFRPRGSLLGDAVNSAPVYAGSPSAGVDGGDTYRAHYDRNQSRSPAVYLGANDGMLHAFDAASGRELFAYVPDALFPRLNLLPEQSYVHGAFVDGPASIAEAQVAGAWKTVLVSAMGAGGQGVFALDVTSPTTFPQNGGVLWEFTDRDDAAMGNVTALPQIARL
eukprot:gene32315-39901_t